VEKETKKAKRAKKAKLGLFALFAFLALFVSLCGLHQKAICTSGKNVMARRR
jgi:hypothetical protein